MPPGSDDRRETAADIDQAAAAWVAKVDRGPLSAADEAALDAWAAADSRRAGAYARSLTINLRLERAAALGKDFHPAPDLKSRRRFMAIGTGLVAASVGGLTIFGIERQQRRDLGPQIFTAKGRTCTWQMPEGSQAVLNTATRLRPAYTAGVRRVELVAGEALFHVVRDSSRPFIVESGPFSVQAIGTSFTVWRLADDGIRVLVAEGVVEVRRDGEAIGRIHAGIELTANNAAAPTMQTLDREQVSEALAWQHGRLELRGVNLADAVQQLNRYSDQAIVIDDPVIGQRHIAGVYATNDPAGFARAAALSLDLRSYRQGGTIHLAGS